MARISGVNLPLKKRVVIALTYIYGIGLSSAKMICDKTGVDGNKKLFSCSEEEINDLRLFIEKECTVEGDLRRFVSVNIKQKIDLGVYSGVRHRKNLPVRGQRTRTNARTRKGRKSAPIAKKKKA